MILVDFREDSKNKAENKQGLWDHLKKTNLPIRQDKLDGGDLMFLGKGPNDSEVTVGIEFKKVRDILDSLRSKRMQGHQLHELHAYDFRFLLIEGEWRTGDSGLVEMRSGWKEWQAVKGSFSASEFNKSLLGLVLRGGIHYVKETPTRKESIKWITDTYRNFTDVKWDDHTSHTGVYRPQGLVKPSEFRHFIMGLPNGCGMGLKTSKAVEEYFRNPHTGKVSPRRVINSRPEVWAEIAGIGKKTAQNIDRFLEGE